MNLSAQEMGEVANLKYEAGILASKLEHLFAAIKPRQGSDVEQALRSATLSADSVENMLRIILQTPTA